MPLIKISVTLKPTLLDAQGRAVHGALKNLGYNNVEKVRIGRYIELNLEDGPDIDGQVREICDKLLANPVIEDYRYEVVK
ncbi:MAG: phosphoribosylformylglycinamidine synthase subunit PurS [Capsulimonadaceae bacterium]|nr:phosphoribosylformylglycinamidine synthase subunit PurS [Capsulimonadaceae bacterium]